MYQSALEQRRSVQDKIVVLDRHYGELEKRLLTLKQALSSHHTDEKIQLQTKKTDLEQEIQSINTTLSLLLREHHELVGARFGVIQSRLDRMIQEAKSHQQELQYMQSEYAQLLTRRDELHTRQLELKQQIALLQSKREDALLFHCDKIAEPCPYVSLITKKTTHAIDDQEVFLTNELKTITDHTLPSLTKNIDELFSRQQQQEEKVSTYKALFQTFDRKKIQALLQEGVQKETALERVRGDWDVFHAILSSQEEKRQEYGRLEQELRLLEGQKKTHQQDLQRLDEQMRLLTVVP